MRGTSNIVYAPHTDGSVRSTLEGVGKCNIILDDRGDVELFHLLTRFKTFVVGSAVLSDYDASLDHFE
jgi:hypothetical protein